MRGGYYFAPAFGATPPKGKGKPGKRPLVIAPLPDRIVQRALLDVLQDATELAGIQAILQTPTSIGGIRGRGVDDAIRQIHEAYQNGARYIAGSDISGFFTKIPRAEVIDFVGRQTDDTNFVDLLSRAMTVELKNAAALDPSDRKLFPTDKDGVAQGCPLSALAGNIVLRDFDAAMNEQGRGVICIRYIDDFMLLGKTEKSVAKAMESAGKRLAEMGMSIYNPNIRPDKAFVGGIEEGHVFLGYKIIPGLYPPAPKACDALVSRLRTEFGTGRAAVNRAIQNGAMLDRQACYVQTLWNVDQVLRGWAGSFRSTRCHETMAKLDAQIDRMIGDFNAVYRRLTEGRSMLDRRRALGVRLLQDSIGSVSQHTQA
jgi:hypothetical protein